MNKQQMIDSLDEIERLKAQALAQGQPLSRADRLFLEVSQRQRDEQKRHSKASPPQGSRSNQQSSGGN